MVLAVAVGSGRGTAIGASGGCGAPPEGVGCLVCLAATRGDIRDSGGVADTWDGSLGADRGSGCGAMRQRILGSHTPPCHRRMVITTLFSVLLAALQRRPVLYHTRWLLTVHRHWSSGHLGQLAPTTHPQCRLVSNPCPAGRDPVMHMLSGCGGGGGLWRAPPLAYLNRISLGTAATRRLSRSF